jgi:altronate dehydratase small subunit
MEKALVIDEKDNVATAISQLKTGEVVSFSVGDRRYNIKLKSDIPFGHKFAICAINKGGDVFKYGEKIGHSLSDISIGELIHVHNIERLGD